MPSEQDVTRLLHALGEGRASAAEALLPLVYDDLRAIAGRYFQQEAPGSTLQPTAIVHEAYLQLAGQSQTRWKDRRHFQAVAAIAMRRLLVDHARARKAQKRGGGLERVTLSAVAAPSGGADVDLVALDDVLAQLEALDPRQYRVVELRFFGGLTEDDIAEVLGVSRTTVQADWRMAKAWLGRALREAGHE